VRSGRSFDGRDQAAAPAVAIVSEALARRTWPGEDPLGRRIVIDGRQAATVVGVAGDVRVEGLDVAAPAVLYVPFTQATFGLFPDWGMDLVVRATDDGPGLAAAVRRQVAAVDPALPLFAVRRLDDLVARSTATRRSALVVLAVFAALAALLSAVGLYGVVSQSARQRRREIGVRLVLGAQRGDVCRLVLAEGLTLALAGGSLGLAAAVAGGRLLESLLFTVRAGDPATHLATAGLLGLLAVAASLGPALRASRADPVAALRHER
jgi:putative ABC transport system permease protein